MNRADRQRCHLRRRLASGALLLAAALSLPACSWLGLGTHRAAPQRSDEPAAPVLPRGETSRPTLLIEHATIWQGNGEVIDDGQLLLADGRIRAVGASVDAPANAVRIDARGRVVTPGLVDMHSHLGVYAAPHARAHADGNEMTSPTLPMVRAVDAFDPEDPAIARALSGGVTSALILPGSGNIMGGQAAYVKLRGKTVADMLLPNPPRALKMAMGENPKRVYGGKGRMPMSRMGHAWLMREQFDKARKLRERMRGQPLREVLREDPSLEPLVALLRGKALLQVHCYEVHDIETLVRIADEFDFRVAAIHHALEAWKVPKLLADRGIAVASFADLWGYKLEAYDASTQQPRILHDAGVAVAIKSDHPVLDARGLIHEAAKAWHYGLPEQAALASVTRIPAQAIGVGERLGTLENGKEADVVIWDRHPFEIGARPSHVIVDGALWVEGSTNHQLAYAGPTRPIAGSPCGCGL
jgi:imidazolonepropionase-like amidohydrolase